MSRNGPGQRDLLRAHSVFLETGAVGSGIRDLVAESWRRSLDAGINAERSLPPVTLDDAQLADYRGEHLLSRVFPLLYDVLGRFAEDCRCVMALGDEKGQLLWVCGRPDMLRKAEAIHFAEGASWDESTAGTNAPGTALRLDAPVIIRAGEHFNRSVQHWSCAAAPIHDPDTQAILGVLDITGGGDVASPQSLGMVRAAARMAEIELARISAVESPARPGPGSGRSGSVGRPARPRLDVEALGRPDCSVTVGGRTVRLSPRHSEILVLLMAAPSGLTGEQLEIQVYPDDVHSSTMRSELTRLRTLLGPDVLESRPYRLTARVDGDWQRVQADLDRDRVAEAVAGYRGPLLPYSEAPGVIEVREGLHRRLRAAVLASGVPDLMASWTRTRWGADDVVVWRRQAELLPRTSPLRLLAAAEANRLDVELGVTHRF
ncbi:GAF domain-containing protein [Nakamurella panacisegetis]|uniref:GAF domain-containing protein n=1 Tax=Nakamurella panacisegetis TaxID=1090615 RepID=A0A1H0J594_9ACTN|nr:GAF domain-containing protein [Nakamurella panacisegetis]SDO38918.1 GAF domain-containing protein [Nakamurella panacisegetis]